MKTLKTFIVALISVVLVSCSGSAPTAEQVAQKIDSKETLSEADYSTMIEYCGEYAKKAQKYYDIINAQANDSTSEYSRAAQDLVTLKSEHPYVDMFRTAIYAADDSQIGEKNVKLVKEYEKYQAFPLPEGSGEDLNQPGVVGDIEEMPASDTSGVISEGAGEVVDSTAK